MGVAVVVAVVAAVVAVVVVVVVVDVVRGTDLFGGRGDFRRPARDDLEKAAATAHQST